ncbi:hypothetical protein BIV60_07210 [Bacillus sp. MUM 116]|nr:hypothetical protein BIV60_07210 [Bacillus sp. MUM 116]
MLIGVEGARLLREYGAGETPQALKRRGGSPDRPRKAKRLERKSTVVTSVVNLKFTIFTHILITYRCILKMKIALIIGGCNKWKLYVRELWFFMIILKGVYINAKRIDL